MLLSYFSVTTSFELTWNLLLLLPLLPKTSSEREIETLEKEIGNSTKSTGQCIHRKKQPEYPLPKSPLIESKMTPIPRLPIPYQPGGEPGRGHINYLDSADAMLETEFSPPDRYFTISALLGRLREPMKLPYPPNSLRAADFTSLTSSKKNEQELEERKIRIAIEKQQSLLLLDKSEIYHMEQPDTTALLALHKKISSHRTAAVFRKPVNPLEGELVWAWIQMLYSIAYVSHICQLLVILKESFSLWILASFVN